MAQTQVESPCLFCLEPVKSTEQCSNPIGCPCALLCHGACLQAWFDSKQQLECPICHTVSVPNLSYEVGPQEIIHIVHVNRPQEDSYAQQRRNERAVGVCCYLLLGWWIGGLIFEAIFH